MLRPTVAGYVSDRGRRAAPPQHLNAFSYGFDILHYFFSLNSVCERYGGQSDAQEPSCSAPHRAPQVWGTLSPLHAARIHLINEPGCLLANVLRRRRRGRQRATVLPIGLRLRSQQPAHPRIALLPPSCTIAAGCGIARRTASRLY
eukprot:364689-Chlamydomonas_euryale.AAC.8